MILGGCATYTQTGALVGGATGAGIGAGIGAAVGGRGGALIGALIGGAVGTAAGAAIGQHYDKLERTRAEAVAYTDYTPTKGNLLLVERAEVIPSVARPGDEVQIKVWYSVLAPDPQTKVPVTETWVFKVNNQQVGDPIVRPTQEKVQGGYSSTYKFTVPRNVTPGVYQYEVLVTISNGTMTQSVAKSFSIQAA